MTEMLIPLYTRLLYRAPAIDLMGRLFSGPGDSAPDFLRTVFLEGDGEKDPTLLYRADGSRLTKERLTQSHDPDLLIRACPAVFTGPGSLTFQRAVREVADHPDDLLEVYSHPYGAMVVTGTALVRRFRMVRNNTAIEINGDAPDASILLIVDEGTSSHGRVILFREMRDLLRRLAFESLLGSFPGAAREITDDDLSIRFASPDTP